MVPECARRVPTGTLQRRACRLGGSLVIARAGHNRLPMSALGSPSFRWLLGSTTAAYLGTGMHLTAIAWLALASSGGAFGVGLVLAARMLPNVVFGLASGTLADRADRRRLLLLVRVVGVLPAVGLAWVASSSTSVLWPLLALSFATG